MPTLDKKQVAMVGQMLNYLQNAKENSIFTHQELDSLGADVKSVISSNELVLSKSQAVVVRKITEWFLENTDQEEFNTLTGSSFGDLEKLSKKFI